MKPKLMIVLAMLAVLSGITIPILNTHSQAMTNQLTSSEAINLVRMISTIEGEKKATEQSFVSLQKLLQHRVMQSRLQEINVVDVDSATIKGYRLSVVPSADGQHFQLSLVPKSGCGYSLFTNESFVIYEAKALGCPD
jgi:Tfp pilus assembly protein PilE